MARFGEPEPLARDHDVEAFDCGAGPLNVWLKKHAVQTKAAGPARTFVLGDDEQQRIVGYYALAAASIVPEQATATARAANACHAIRSRRRSSRVPSTLASKVVASAPRLLRDAMLRTLGAAEAVGMRVVLVHALDDDTRRFYERHGFEPSPTDPLNLQMLLKDIRVSVDAASA